MPSCSMQHADVVVMSALIAYCVWPCVITHALHRTKIAFVVESNYHPSRLTSVSFVYRHS